ncbi:PREDICTED: probable disease resistance protein At5g66900 isoform X2 [Fragaria vesca subsp. vesca]|uniref:probable disease resistance protein At5g66900 isoform X2 n=1 Tax=Fragaria vesca subsp. vesca TaxID=101020 RepID=UPI0002C2FB93|nr:PREDICTED: probable disease resistance protein At5g66900 isoform X2 [Fragaria vesca subsp. vesca]
MSIDPVELALGAVLGTAFSVLYAGVEDLIAKNHLFRGLFKDIKSKLDTLKPLLADMTLSNKQLLYANNDELRGLEQVLKAGEELVLKCSKVSKWDLYRKYKYATKLFAWGEDLESQFKLLQVHGIRDGKRTAVGVSQISSTLEEVNQRMKENFMIQDQSAWCGVPALPEIIVGLEAPLEKLKTELLGNEGFSMLVLTAPGGCGKTTLATKFCTDQEVKDKFGENIYFVTVSKKYSLNSIVEQLYRRKGCQVPTFQNEVNAVQGLQQFLKDEGGKPLLLVLDDVWSGSDSLLHKFDCKMAKMKILVTSRSEFRAFCPPYRLEMLGCDDAMKLFHHSASLGDKSSHIPLKLARKIVERCKGFPLAITVVGRSLCAQPIEMWQDRLNQWSKGSSIFDYETDLLLSLQSSLDALDKERAIIKQCFLDLGSFPEDKRIPVNALIDIWSELYDDIHEDTSCIAALYELNNRSLANLTDNRAGKLDGEGYYDDHYVTQHDLLRELAIFHSKLESAELRERLFIDICGSNLPKWWREQKYQALKARLLSISTDGESSTLKWPDMHLPETEVLVLNLREIEKYAIPEFVEKMENLKVLVITNEDLPRCELTNPQLLSWFSNLKRMRLEGLSLSSILKNSIQVKSLRKLSLIKCETEDISSEKFSHAFPNLEEMYMDQTGILKPLFRGLCDLISLKKLTICLAHGIEVPDEIGKLVNLEELRLMSSIGPSKFPDSIRNLKKLNTLCVLDCMSLNELPECIGEMRSLRKMDTRGCDELKKLPLSILNLKQLEEVIFDEYTESAWQPLLPSLSDKNRDIHIVVAAIDPRRLEKRSAEMWFFAVERLYMRI